jgi:NADH:quinone reductase (non-electrogenic)
MFTKFASKRILVVGGGFAGIGYARALARHSDLRISLIDKNNYHQFQPMLYQVATSQVSPGDISY